MTLRFLVLFFITASLADAYTTWCCLHEVVPGWSVREANPIVAWMIDRLGLVRALALDTIINILVILWLYRTHLIKHGLKKIALYVFNAITWYAVGSNYYAMLLMGLN
jgi:hypothetical protein